MLLKPHVPHFVIFIIYYYANEKLQLQKDIKKILAQAYNFEIKSTTRSLIILKETKEHNNFFKKLCMHPYFPKDICSLKSKGK